MLFKLISSVALFTGFLFAQEHNFYDTTLMEIFSAISNEHNTILDIAPLPEFDELTHLDDEDVNQALESLSSFNDLLADYKSISQSVEDSGESCMDYDTCEIIADNFIECTYFRDKGDHSITVIQQITPHWYNYCVYCSGVYDGVDYGSMYLLQEQYIDKNGKHFSFELYRPPSPPESANQRIFSFQCWIFDAENTIYTPWGTFSDQKIVFKSTCYMWDPTINDNRPFCHSETNFIGSRLHLTSWAWSFKNEELYCYWAACWDFSSLTGTWISFDEDGIPQRTGTM